MTLNKETEEDDDTGHGTHKRNHRKTTTRQEMDMSMDTAMVYECRGRI